MATEAQIQANRANAKKSTGPRTDAGKARSRLNALKHGFRARRVDPVLPQEDAGELQARIQEWLDDYKPTNAVERDLVVRGAKIAWSLDRAERHETALLSRRVRQALLHSRARGTAKACGLGRKLLYLTGKRLLPGSGPDWADDPAAFVAALEETPEGARWLLDRWVEVRCLIISDELWTYQDQFKFVRLLGKQPFDAIDDAELNEIFLAWEVIEEGWGVRFWKKVQETTPYEDPAFSAWRLWRELVTRPADADAAVALLRGVAQREIDRLEALIVDLDVVEGEDATEAAEQASFSAGDGSERLRRYQAVRGRELIKTIETLSKLRKESAKPEPKSKAKPTPAPKPSPIPKPAPAAAAKKTTTTEPKPAAAEPVSVNRVMIASPVPAIPEGSRIEARRRPVAPAPMVEPEHTAADFAAIRLRVVREQQKTGPRERGGRPSGLWDQGVGSDEAAVRPAASATSPGGSRRATGSPG
ncbi:hypothetical protein [Paludisphaera mucosa]|uniref:Uncharacterized protein n=1 Tax=Paludisphaera mucosa TaxID=3030827 RepID=A0ABT6FKR8_9BACT|nr:hypothetical protein [Paludisphaera mucosa]MDG3008109.1 hypothetical protein [Paludisphaera mucosa]